MNTNDDLRGYGANSPVGLRDGYQYLLIVGGHGLRHTMQMEEIIAHYNSATASSK